MNDKDYEPDQFDLAYGVRARTGEVLTIRITPPVGRIAAYLLDEGGMGPLPNLAYELRLDGEVVARGETDAAGYLCHDEIEDDYYTLKVGDQEYCLGTLGEDDEPHQVCVLGQDADWMYQDIDPEHDADPARSRL